MKNYNCYPLGDSAIVLQFGDVIDEEVNMHIRSICCWLDEYTFEGFLEYVPGYTTITIYYQPWIVGFAELRGMMDEMLESVAEELPPPSKLIEIPVCYGGVYGPDLAFIASHNGLLENDVVNLHTSAEYLVYMIGFAPGFPYLGGLNEKIAAPRKASPSLKVPAGSVGIAGMQTGIYPLETPGGWQIIGNTPLALFDTEREQPSLLKAGDKVKFKSISEFEYLDLKGDDDGY